MALKLRLPFFNQERQNYDSIGDKTAMVLEKVEQPSIIDSFKFWFVEPVGFWSFPR